MIYKLLEGLSGYSWKLRLIGVSTDCAAKLAGRCSGAVTRIVQQFHTNTFRIWCSSHQLGFEVQYSPSQNAKESFYDLLKTLGSYLRG